MVLAAGPTVRFAAVGDVGKGNPTQYAVAAAIATVCAREGCDFVVLLGDNVYPDGLNSDDDVQWQTKLEAPLAPVQGPIYAVFGNHDYGGSFGEDTSAVRHQIASAAKSPKWRLPAAHYSFRVGDADFFAADTNRSMLYIDKHSREAIRAWYAQSTARWRIVFGHHNYRSNGNHGNAGNYDRIPSWVPIASGGGVKSFVEDEVCGKADAYLSGHVHILEWLTDGCGTPISTALLVSGTGSEPTRLRATSIAAYRWHSSEPGFLYVTLSPDTLTGTFYDRDGGVLYSDSIHKR